MERADDISVLASAIIFLVSGISLEAFVGVVIAIFIIKAGIEMMIETLNDIIGQRGDLETVRGLKEVICEEEEVRGAYDVTLYNYGPNKNYASAHIELPDTMSVNDVDQITRRIQYRVFRKTGIILTGIGVYSYNTSNDEAAQMRNAVQETVLSHDWALQVHGFYVDMEKKTMRFDTVISFDIDRKEAVQTICNEVQNMYPDYKVYVITDIDVSDLEGEEA